MFTDPNRTRADVPGRVDGNPVFVYHDIFNSNKEELKDFKDRYKIFCSVCKNNKDSTLQLKYEKFYNDYEYIFDKFEKFFSVKINDELRHEIKHDTSLKKNLKLQTGLKEFAEHDMVSGIHGDHIAYPEICGYRKLLAPNVISWAERSFESEIKYWELYDETI